MAKVKNTNKRTSLESFAQDDRISISGQSGAGTGAGGAGSMGAGTQGMIPRVGTKPVGKSISGGTGALDPSSQVQPFNFLECPEISINGSEPVECPVCTPNPYAYVPDYTTMMPGETYFDGKNCRQCYVLEVAPPKYGGPKISELDNPTQKQEDIKRIGIRNLLDYYNKSATVVVYYYEEEEYGRGTDVAGGAAVLLGAKAGGTVGSAAGPVGTVIGASLGALVGALAAIAVPDSVPGYVLRAEERDVIEELLNYTEIKYTVPIQLKGRTKISVCVDIEAWERIPTKLETQPDTPFEAEFEVTFTGQDFDEMFKHVSGDAPLGIHNFAGALRLYAKQLEKWRDLEGGMLETVDGNNLTLLDLNNEADKMIKFKDAVSGIIKEATGLDMDDLEKISFKFEPTQATAEREDPDIRLKQLMFNKKGCPDIIFSEEDEEGSGYFRKLIKKEPFGHSRTLYFVGALPDMDADVLAGDTLPWLEFVLKYTYPKLQVSYSSTEDMFNDPSLGACLADSLLDEDGVVGATLEALGKELLGLPDAILAEFSENLCLTEEQLAAKKVQFRPDFKKDLNKTLDEAKKEFGKGDPYLDSVWQYLENVTRARKNPKAQAQGIWNTLMSRLGYCGWIALMEKALDCLVQGMDEESFKKAVVDAALKSMADPALQLLMSGLPQEDKDRITALAGAKFANLPAPWDTQAYQIGSYNSPGMTANEEYDAVMEVPDTVGVDPEGDELPSLEEEMGSDAYNRAVEDAKAQIEANKAAYDQTNTIAGLEANIALVEESISDIESGYLFDEGVDPSQMLEDAKEMLKDYEQQLYDTQYPPEDRQIDTSGGLFGVLYEPETGDFSFGEYETGGGDTYGEALGAIQKELFDAYRNVIMDAVDIDVLFDALAKLPGAPVIGQFIKTLPCKPPNMLAFDPRLDSFMNTLEFDFCHIAGDKTFDLTLPDTTLLLPKPGSWNIGKIIYLAVKKAIMNAVVAVIMAALKSLLSWLMNLACNILKSLGANIADLYDGSDHFRQKLVEELCPGASEDQLNESLKNLFGALGGPESDCLKTITNEEMGSFIDDISLMLTQDQIFELLSCNPSPETLALALEVARISTSQCIRELFSDPGAIKDFFCSLAIFVPPEVFDMDLPDLPASPCPPEVFAQIEDIKCGLLSNKGLSKKECRKELDKAKEKSIQDLQDLIDMLQNGPMANFPSMDSTGNCPAEGFYPSGPDPISAQVNSSLTSLLLTPIETGVVTDLMGGAGVLNNILADTNGDKWTWHYWKVRLFGTPLAAQQSFLDFTCDDAIKSLSDEEGKLELGFSGLVYDPKPVNIYNEEVEPGNFLGISSGGFPPTVGAWMAKTFREIEAEFKTTVVPEGYSSLAAASADFESKKEINDRRIKIRQDYVSAFVKQYDLDGPTTNKDTADLVGMLRRACYSKRVLENGVRHEFEESEPDGNKASEISKSVYFLELLLTGAEISGVGFQLFGIGHSAKFPASEVNPSSWSDSSQELAGTDGAIFTDYYSVNQFKLVDVPSIISPDISLAYEGHDTDNDGDGLYKYSVNYDYNLPDDDGFIGRENTYKIKIDVSAKHPTFGTPYEYAEYDFVVQPNLDTEVKQYINTLPISDTVSDSWQAEVLYRMMSDVIINAGDGNQESISNALDSSGLRGYFAEPTNGVRKIDDISSGFFRRLSIRIATGKTFTAGSVGLEDDDEFLGVSGEASTTTTKNPVLENIAPGFRYGYDPAESPQIIYLDNETYGGALGKLFPDLVPPPFYVAPPVYTGWKEITEAMVPSADGCEPSRGPLFALGDLSSAASGLASDLKDDERFNFDPLCATEAPYDKILDTTTAANIDVVMRAATRVYITEALMRSVPILSQFEINENNIEAGIVEFIVERMKKGLKPDGESSALFGYINDVTNDDDYYYRFMEQVFNSVSRRVDSGLLDPDEDFNVEEKDAYDLLKGKIQEFYDKNKGKLASLSSSAIKNQSFMKNMFDNTATAKFGGAGAGSSDFSKAAATRAKQYAFELMIDETIDAALVFLKRMVREEMPIVGASFNSVLSAPIKNVDHLFLLSPAWIRGAVNADGPIDVVSNPNQASSYNIPSGQATSVSDHISNLKDLGLGDFADNFDTALAGMDEWPFVLEKYIRVFDSADDPAEVSGRQENLYGVINMNDWKSYVDSRKAEGVTGKISDLFGKYLEDGETSLDSSHFHTFEVDENGNGFALLAEPPEEEDIEPHIHRIVNFEIKEFEGHTHSVPKPAWKFGLRLCYMPEKDAGNIFGDAINKISKSAKMREKAYEINSPDGKRYLLPFASAEIDIPDQEFTLFDPEAYDVYCLIPPLINSPEYKAMFRYVFPLPRFLSLLTIYCMQGFYDSLGNTGLPEEGGDMWENNGGNFASGFAKWDRGDAQVFEESRKAARNAFTSLYETMQAEYDSSSVSKKTALSFSDVLKPKIDFEDGLRWWQRGKRLKKSPFNADGDSCKN